MRGKIRHGIFFSSWRRVCLCLWVTTRVDDNHATDFSRSYLLLAESECRQRRWQDRIMPAVDQQLINEGWQRVPSGGDATVAAVGSTRTEQRLETFYNGFGGWYWRGFGDGSRPVR